MFMNRKNCQDVSSSQIDLQILCNLIQNPSKLFYGHQQINPKMYLERQKIQNSQYNIEGEKQSWRTDAIQLQDLS